MADYQLIMYNLANRLTELDPKLNYEETVSKIELICREEFQAEYSEVVESAQARERLAGLDEQELEMIRDKKPVKKEGSLYIPLKNNGNSLGFLYLQETKKDDQEMLSFAGSLGGLILSLQQEKEKSRYDGLTGLLRKDEFKEQHSYTYILIDLDNFKKYNDSYGHLQGDTALAAVGKVVKENVRGKDIGVRYGGEELLIALHKSDQDEAYLVAERIRAEIEKMEVDASRAIKNKESYPSGPRKVTVSAGCGKSVAEADAALYRAKSSGKNRVAG